MNRPPAIRSTVRAMSARGRGCGRVAGRRAARARSRSVASAQAASSDQHSKMGGVAVAVQREEVVPGVGDVVAEVLGAQDGAPQAGVVPVLGMELGGDPDRAHRLVLGVAIMALVAHQSLNLHPRSKSRGILATMLRIGTFARLAGVVGEDPARLRRARPVPAGLGRPGDRLSALLAGPAAGAPPDPRAPRRWASAWPRSRASCRAEPDLGEVLDRRRAALERERREVDRRLAALDIRVERQRTDRTGSTWSSGRVAAEPVATLDAEAGVGPRGRRSTRSRRTSATSAVRAHRPPGALVARPRRPGDFVPVRRSGQDPADRLAAPAGACGPRPSSTTARTRRSSRPVAALEAWIVAAGFNGRRTAPGPLPPVRRRGGARPAAGLPRPA